MTNSNLQYKTQTPYNYAFSFFTCLTLLVFSVSGISGQHIDIRTLEKINLNRNTSLDIFFKTISNTTGLISYSVPTGLLAAGYFIDHDYTRRKGWYLVETALVNAAITTTLKYSINRTRPFISYPYIIRLDKGNSPSFPSGHTSDAFALAASLSISYPRWYTAAASFTWAGTVGYSRLHLGVHYPSDVIGGAVVGAGSAWLCHFLNRKLFTRKKN